MVPCLWFMREGVMSTGRFERKSVLNFPRALQNQSCLRTTLWVSRCWPVYPNRGIGVLFIFEMVFEKGGTCYGVAPFRVNGFPVDRFIKSLFDGEKRHEIHSFDGRDLQLHLSLIRPSLFFPERSGQRDQRDHVPVIRSVSWISPGERHAGDGDG